MSARSQLKFAQLEGVAILLQEIVNLTATTGSISETWNLGLGLEF